MSRSSDARKAKRQQQRAGVALVERVVVGSDALAAAVMHERIDPIDVLMHAVHEAVRSLASQGGSVLEHTVITIGDHPDHPGALTVEAKVSRMLSQAERDAADLAALDIDLEPDSSVDDEPLSPAEFADVREDAAADDRHDERKLED